jgi:hypothetical protein
MTQDGGQVYRFGQGGYNKGNARNLIYLAFMILQGWLRPISLQVVDNISN